MCLSAWAGLSAWVEGDSLLFAAKRVFPRTAALPAAKKWDSPLRTVTFCERLRCTTNLEDCESFHKDITRQWR